MRKVYWIGFGMILLLLLAWPAAAGDEKVSFTFDDIEVIYAAKFNAIPVEAYESGWAAELAGGSTQPLNVLYGVVNLKRGGATITSQEFLKISGAAGSERLLANAYTTNWYSQEEAKYDRLQSSRTLFWSAIQISENLLDKDINGWSKAVTFQREFDESGNLTDVKLFFTDDGNKDRDLFWNWSHKLQGYLYQADLTSLQNVGKPTSTKQ